MSDTTDRGTRLGVTGDLTSRESVSIGVVIVASQGCEHARAVISAVRSQLGADDALVVVESGECAGVPTDFVGGERHEAVATHDEAEMKLIGFGLLSADVLLALEDHGVPPSGFLGDLRCLFVENPELQASAFFLRNGTDGDLPSRALFSFVAGFADADASIAVPQPVCSSYAIRGATLARLESHSPNGAMPRNALEYEIIPALANRGLDALPRELAITHFQVNTARQVATAIFWNGRIAGSSESRRGLAAARPTTVIKRYLGRAVRLNRVKRRSADELAFLTLLGAVGFAGWWTGRVFGQGGADDRIRAVHPEPAP